MGKNHPRGEAYTASGADMTMLQQSTLQHAPAELASMVLGEADQGVTLYLLGLLGYRLGGKTAIHSIVADGASLGFLVGLIEARIRETEARTPGELARYISGKDQASGAVRTIPSHGTLSSGAEM